jgi:DNA-binding CsgD family transcriptional regulator
MFLIDADRFDDAVAVLRGGLRAHEALGARPVLPIHHGCIGFSHFWSGRWDEAVAEVETGIDLAEETGTGWRLAHRGIRAAVAVARGDLATAERWLDLADAELAAGEAPYRIAWLHWARALWQEASGSPVTVLDALAAPGITLATVGPTAVRLALACNRGELARSVTSALSALANKNPGLAGIAAAQRCAEGLLARDAGMVASAADAYRRAGRPVEQAMAADAGRAVAADRGLAGELRAQALVIYRALDATSFARRLGSGRMPRRPAHGWGAITATELRVLRFVAERRTNEEIAAALGLSRRTVETHVAHILGKAGLRSRLQLGDAAARHFGWRLRLEEPVQDRQKA